jgi:hypothetical protein
MLMSLWSEIWKDVCFILEAFRFSTGGIILPSISSAEKYLAVTKMAKVGEGRKNLLCGLFFDVDFFCEKKSSNTFFQWDAKEKNKSCGKCFFVGKNTNSVLCIDLDCASRKYPLP